MASTGNAAEPILLFPCNGNALEAIGCLGDRYYAVGFVDDTPNKQGTTAFGLPVAGRDAFTAQPEARVLALPGGPTSFRRRPEIIGGLGLAMERFATVIHPHAFVSPLARIGRNVLVMAGVVITSNAVIGNHVCILPNTVIHHDCTVGDWTLIGSNVSVAGNVLIGQNSYIGSGSRIINGIEVGAGALVGLGSNVIRAVAEGGVVAGNPARILKSAP